jgi:DNA polymerase III epsilon subunit-like protein
MPHSAHHNHRCVVFDLETTGLSVHKGDRIIEIGAVAVEEVLDNNLIELR